MQSLLSSGYCVLGMLASSFDLYTVSWWLEDLFDFLFEEAVRGREL